MIRKSRTPYRLTHEGRPVEVVLDVAEGIGTFVEVETIAGDEADLPDAQRVVIEPGRVAGADRGRAPLLPADGPGGRAGLSPDTSPAGQTRTDLL